MARGDVPDLVGQRFGDWEVLACVGKNAHYIRMWLCRCACGTKHEVQEGSMKAGRSVRCRACSDIVNLKKTKHGMYETSEYHTWESMIGRCYNKNNHKYSYYGGRGITVCDRWRSEGGFIQFFADMGEKPSADHSIDRIDVNGNYEPSNCRWATPLEQQNNLRSNHNLTAFGETRSISAWAREYGISVGGIQKRLKKGLPVEQAISMPPNPLYQRTRL